MFYFQKFENFHPFLNILKITVQDGKAWRS